MSASLALRMLTVIVAAGLVALLSYGLAAQTPDTTIAENLATGELDSAPGFSHEVLALGETPSPLSTVVTRAAADNRISLDELRGTAVVLNVWASWCEPCQREAPVLERGWLRAASKGVLFLGLDQQDNRPDAREFIAEYDVSYPNVHEAGRETSRRYGMTGIPETFFISPNGMIVGRVIGAVDDEQLQRGVAAAQAGTVVDLGAGGERRASP